MSNLNTIIGIFWCVLSLVALCAGKRDVFLAYLVIANLWMTTQ